jgi:hypothetical protein
LPPVLCQGDDGEEKKETKGNSSRMSNLADAVTEHETPPFGIKNKTEIDPDQRFHKTVSDDLEQYKNKLNKPGSPH